MNKLKKIISSAILIATVLMLCGGCGNTNKTNNGNKVDTPTPSNPAWWQVGLLDYDLTEEELSTLIDDYYFDENGVAKKEIWTELVKTANSYNGENINSFTDEFIEYIEGVEITGYTISTINLYSSGLAGCKNNVEMNTHYLVEFIPTGYMICKKNNFTQKLFYLTKSPCAILGIDYKDIYLDINMTGMFVENETGVFSSIDYQALYYSNVRNPASYIGLNEFLDLSEPNIYEKAKNYRMIYCAETEYTKNYSFEEGYYESFFTDQTK